MFLQGSNNHEGRNYFSRRNRTKAYERRNDVCARNKESLLANRNESVSELKKSP